MKNVLKIVELRTLVATLLPACIGIMVSKIYYAHVNWGLTLLLIVSACFIQMATNVINDYSDLAANKTHAIDAQVEEEKSLLTLKNRKFYKKTFMILYLVAIIIGLIVAFFSSWVVLVIGVIGVVVSLNYSVGKFPISYTPLGESVAGVVMGFGIPLAVVWVNSGSYNSMLFWITLPAMMMIGTLLMTNNVSDIERDTVSGRRTLPMLLGRVRSKRVIISLSQLSLIFILIIPYFIFHMFSIVAIIAIILLWNKIGSLKKFKFEYSERRLTMTLVAKLTLLINLAYIITLIEILMRLK